MKYLTVLLAIIFITGCKEKEKNISIVKDTTFKSGSDIKIIKIINVQGVSFISSTASSPTRTITLDSATFMENIGCVFRAAWVSGYNARESTHPTHIMRKDSIEICSMFKTLNFR